MPDTTEGYEDLWNKNRIRLHTGITYLRGKWIHVMVFPRLYATRPLIWIQKIKKNKKNKNKNGARGVGVEKGMINKLIIENVINFEPN